MKISFNRYTLNPLQKANRLSKVEPVEGVILRGDEAGVISFADYFPHVALGDEPVDEFLKTFSKQESEYSRKTFYFLNLDRCYQNQKAIPFHNHQLWKVNDPLDSTVVKYKLEHERDTQFLIALFKGMRVRLDSNGLFDRQGFIEFAKLIPPHLQGLIDYVEDPLHELDWSGLPLSCAQDIIKGNPSDYLVYKPNRGFLPATKTPVIFSSNLGHELGKWHAYSELVNYGDLKVPHGIVTTGYYEEERGLFTGHYLETFTPDLEVVKGIYEELHSLPWTHLCSI